MIVRILVGLPASGKTTFAQSLRNVEIMDMDSYRNEKDRAFERLKRTLYSAHRNRRDLIVDGLFLSLESQSELVSSLIDYKDFLNTNDKPEIKFDKIVFEYWMPDVIKCLMNDVGRRKQSSEITIKNAVVYKPDTKKFSELFPDLKFERQNHTVVVKDKYKLFFAKHNDRSADEEVIKSSSWCIGGTWGNCWGDSGNVSTEDPVEFTEFDELLEMICPTVTFLQYKKIFSQCVTTEQTYDSDYYGGSTTSSYYVCNKRYLYETLLEMKLITEEE